MDERKILLEKLQKRNEALHPIIFVGFETSEALGAHKKQIEAEINEYFSNLEQIRGLEWGLMTPEEQAHQLEVQKKIKAKRAPKTNDGLGM